MDDLISRQAAIDSIEKHLRFGDELYPLTDTDKILNHGFEIAASCVYNLPSAQPPRIKGRWIGTDYDGFADGNPVYDEWMCSECGCVVEDEEPTWNFCPSCGADMRGEDDE